MNFELIQNYKSLIDKRLIELAYRDFKLEKTLFSAAKYSLEGSAKRLRPILILIACNDFGIDIKDALDPACSLELVHSYSLIHDDLPCMDDDDMRRGKPSLHKQYSEATAILTGDYFLTLAFDVLACAKNLTDSQKVQLVTTLSKRAGANGMIGGQVIDIEQENESCSLEILTKMHEKKTAALIQCSLEFAAIICKLDEKTTKDLSLFGKNLGVAFQVIDDILDVTKSSNALEKPAKSDEKNQKSTSILILGLEKAKNWVDELTQNALSYLPKEAVLLKKLAENMLSRSF